MWMGNQFCVVVSDPNIARDLFVVNGAVFSSRKNYFLKNQIILRGRAITGTVYGDTWYWAFHYLRAIAAYFVVANEQEAAPEDCYADPFAQSYRRLQLDARQ